MIPFSPILSWNVRKRGVAAIVSYKDHVWLVLEKLDDDFEIRLISPIEQKKKMLENETCVIIRMKRTKESRILTMPHHEVEFFPGHPSDVVTHRPLKPKNSKYRLVSADI